MIVQSCKATSLKLLIQKSQPHVRVERDSGMCVARDLYELWGRSPYTRMFVARPQPCLAEKCTMRSCWVANPAMHSGHVNAFKTDSTGAVDACSWLFCEMISSNSVCVREINDKCQAVGTHISSALNSGN